MVAAAVPQNSKQLLSRYDQFALKWEKVEALRLVSWIAKKAGLFKGSGAEEIPDMDEDNLTEILTELWGRKLGKDSSREGHSADWVIAALSDFRGQVQARDLVRLLYLAAKRSKGNGLWLDRVLAPQAIRDAVADCSEEKIGEIEEENPALREVFGKLRALPDDKKNVPFRLEDVGLTPPDIQLLDLNGIVLFDEGSYYMAEIFRRALGFRLPSGKRPKILALARKRRGGVS